MAITQVSLIPEAGRRGVDARDTFVTKQEAFQDSLNSSFIPQFNNMATDIQAMAEFSVFSNPVWEAKAYTADYSVNYNGNCYISTEATIATDVPIVSPKWKQTNASVGGADMQVFTTSGTWTKPAGASMVRIILCGGGGGGGSGGKCGTTVTKVVLGGGGGGGGGVCDLTFPASLLSSTQSVTVGAMGSGGVGLGSGTVSDGYPGVMGTDGGDTSFYNFTVKGGKRGYASSPTNNPSCSHSEGGASYMTDVGTLEYPTNTTDSTVKRAIFSGASAVFSWNGSSMRIYSTFSTFGGCGSGGIITQATGAYMASQSPPVASQFGGACGGGGVGIYLNSASTRAIDNRYISGYAPTKFLPSLFGSYTSVGGSGGIITGYVPTGAGNSGTNATGYGAGGGGGSASNENNTPGNGGNGSPGIAIIISW